MISQTCEHKKTQEIDAGASTDPTLKIWKCEDCGQRLWNGESLHPKPDKPFLAPEDMPKSPYYLQFSKSKKSHRISPFNRKRI